jgi:hypothetical protein
MARALRLLDVIARRPTRRHASAVMLTLLAGLAGADMAHARSESRALATAATRGFESCVDGAAIRFGADDRYAMLEGADARLASDSIVARYPLVARDGLAPRDIVLWRHPQFGWVYVALLVNPAKAGELCFTGVFGASAFDATARLLDKYFGSADAAAQALGVGQGDGAAAHD